MYVILLEIIIALKIILIPAKRSGKVVERDEHIENE